MDRFDCIYQLDGVIKHSRYPVAKQKLKIALACSGAIVKRTIRERRNYLAPSAFSLPLRKRGIEGDFIVSELKGWHTSLWFNGGELFALLTSQQHLKDIQPRLLEDSIKSFFSKDHYRHCYTQENSMPLPRLRHCGRKFMASRAVHQGLMVG